MMLSALFFKFKSLLVAAGIITVAIGVAFLKGISSGEAIYQAKMAKQRETSRKRARKIENEINNLGSDKLRKRSSRWLRNK